MQSTEYKRLRGIPASPGIAIGRAFIYRKETPRISTRRIPAGRVEAEVERFLNSLHQAGEEIRRIQHLVEVEQGSDMAQIFEAQRAMLEDVEVKDQTLNLIRERHFSAEQAFSVTLGQIKRVFEDIENEYLRARLSDVVDIEHQVLVRMAGGELKALHALRANTVVVLHDLLPSEVVQLGRRPVKGIVTDAGGATSHTSIIARSMGLPTIVGAVNSSREIKSGDLVIVDGNEGRRPRTSRPGSSAFLPHPAAPSVAARARLECTPGIACRDPGPPGHRIDGQCRCAE